MVLHTDILITQLYVKRNFLRSCHSLSFFNKNPKVFCDLIICPGKIYDFFYCGEIVIDSVFGILWY